MTSTPVNNNHSPDPEKGIGLTFDNTVSPSPSGGHQGHAHYHPHLTRARERLRHFLHPDGRKIHVANSPEEAISLRQKLSSLHKDDEFEIYISGTAEHLDALRKAQSHHEDRQDVLRMQHPEVFQRFADVQAELDALSYELDRVTTHGVSLEAHFNKFGYGAHIRSYDDEESPSASGSATPRSSSRSTNSDSSSKGKATSLKLFKVPVVRQYFHKGIIWRSSGSEEVQSFELFVDLLYVGIIAVIGDATSEHPTGESLLRFFITFTLSWKIWNDMTLIISWFETDDIFQRVSILVLLATLFGYTTNMTESLHNTWPTLVGFYLAARLFMASYLIIVGILVRMVRNIMIYHAVMAIIGSALWIGSIQLPYPNRLALTFVAMFMDMFSQSIYFIAVAISEKFGARMKERMDDLFEFYPAINIEHRTERMNAFVGLVFGFTVVALLYQSTVNGIDAHYGKAVLGLTQAYCFNWLYFEVDGSNLHVHAIRRHKWSTLCWTTAHLPFIMSFVLAGGALARLVLAVDTPDSHLDALTESYRLHAEPEIPIGIRWFYCAGLGIALICMGIISISHVHRDIEGLRFRKRTRLMGRFAVAIVLICLPLARKLNSLELVGTVTALVVFVLGIELWASSSCHQKLCVRDRPCRYTGHCGKKDLVNLIRHGKEVDVAALGDERRNSGLKFAGTT